MPGAPRTTQEESIRFFLLRQYYYNPCTGVFIFRNGARKGKIAGTKMTDGYISLNINRVRGKGSESILAHRAAWIYIYDEIPIEIDHKDRTTGNNSIWNLRNVTRIQNTHNRSDNTSGIGGVDYVFLRHNNRWRARLRGKHLGYFATKGEAYSALQTELNLAEIFK